LVTPPVGPGLYVAMVQADVSLKDIFLWSLPFLIILLLVMAIINIFPVFSLWLPALYQLI
jgi:TRAP-type C4-dicarboxylate transport system permease large subunit